MGAFTDDFFTTGHTPIGSSGDRSGQPVPVGSNQAPLASAQSSSQQNASTFDALQAKARIEGGETVEAVAKSYGITTRALRVRLGKVERGRDPLFSARQALGADRPTGKPTGAAASTAAPVSRAGGNQSSEQIAAQEEIDRAIADFRRYITPEALVDSFDGLQTSVTKMGAFLLEAKLTPEELALIPFEPIEKNMLKPWMSFSLASIETALRSNPALGMQIMLVLMGTMLVRRGMILAYGYKRRTLLEKRAGQMPRAATFQAQAPPGAAEEAEKAIDAQRAATEPATDAKL